jgi:hypothetical protein
VTSDLNFAGIDPGTQATGFIDFHSLRKTLSTRMAAGGMSQRARQASSPVIPDNESSDKMCVSIHLNPATNNHFKCRHFGEAQIGIVGSTVSRRWELTDVESAQYGGTSGNPRTGAAELVLSPDRR